MRIAIDILIGVGALFAFAGVVGMLRMPDAYSRMQSSTNVSTLGVLGVVIGGLLYAAFCLHNGEMAVKLAVLGVFYIITSPISGHAIAKAAYHHGVRPEKKMDTDKYGEDLEQ